MFLTYILYTLFSLRTARCFFLINDLSYIWVNSKGEKNLFLHASLPIVKPYFPDDYFCHFALLVTMIRLLTNDVISDSEIEIATLFIWTYQQLIPSLYGKTEQTSTCHVLGHLADQVTRPPYFTFELCVWGYDNSFQTIVRNLLLAQNSGSFMKKETEAPEEIKSFIEGKHHMQERELCS